MTEQLLELKKINNYLTEEYCISCAYFQQTKGNFGKCKVIPERKPYDGTKKESACSAYRLIPNLYDIAWKKKFEKKLPIVKMSKLIRESYNEYERKKFILNKRLKVRHSGVIKHNTKGQPVQWHGLPYSQTSDIHSKSGYFMHKYNYQIINYALDYVKQGWSYERITERVNLTLGTKIRLSTIKKWGEKFIDSNTLKSNPDISSHRWYWFWFRIENKCVQLEVKLRPMNVKTCPFCNSIDVKKNGIRRNKNTLTQRLLCNSCDRRFSDVKKQFKKMKHSPVLIKRVCELHHLNLSSRQIVDVVKREFGIIITHSSVSNWIRKYIPNAKLQKNASWRPEIRERIAIGVSQYWKERIPTTKHLEGNA